MKEIMKGIDELYSLFKRRKRIPLKEAATILKIPPATALQWARALQEEGILDVEFLGDDVVLVWMSHEGKPLPHVPSDDELKRKSLKEVEAEFKRLVDEYGKKIEEIRGKSTELQHLGKARAEIIYTKYIPLERRFEAELQLLHDQLLEKERQIGELEKRIREVPNRMASVEEQARKLDQIEAYARKNVSESKIRTQAEVMKIHELQTAVAKSLREVAIRIEEQTLKLKLVEKEIIRLRKIEQWMDMQQLELERKLAEVSEVKKASLKQYSTIRASVTTDYIKNYIKELTMLKERHAKEIYDIRRREEDLNLKVTKARKDLARLSTDSRVLVERFEKAAKRKGKMPVLELEEFRRDLETVAAGNIE